MCVNYLHMYVPPTNQLDNENYNLHKCWSPCNFITWNMLGVASRKTIPGEENIYIFEDAMYDLSIFSSKTNIINSFARKYHCIMTVDTYIIYLFFPPKNVHPSKPLLERTPVGTLKLRAFIAQDHGNVFLSRKKLPRQNPFSRSPP